MTTKKKITKKKAEVNPVDYKELAEKLQQMLNLANMQINDANEQVSQLRNRMTLDEEDRVELRERMSAASVRHMNAVDKLQTEKNAITQYLTKQVEKAHRRVEYIHCELIKIMGQFEDENDDEGYEQLIELIDYLYE